MKLAKFSTRKEKVEIDRTIESVEIDMDFTQMYDCFLILSMGIKSTTSFQVMFYLLRIMGKDNLVTINSRTFDEFNKHRLRAKQKTISEQTFYKCTKDLKNAMVMNKIPGDRRGTYFINPYGFWKADKKDRVAYIREDAGPGQTISMNPINMLLNDADHQYTLDTTQIDLTDEDINEID